MNTKDYVKAFWELNFKAEYRTDCEAFFEPLSTQPQEWPSEPVYEALDAEEWVDSPEPQKASVEPQIPVVPVVPVVPVAPVAPVVSDQSTRLEYVFRDDALPEWLVRGVPPDWLGSKG